MKGHWKSRFENDEGIQMLVSFRCMPDIQGEPPRRRLNFLRAAWDLRADKWFLRQRYLHNFWGQRNIKIRSSLFKMYKNFQTVTVGH